MHLPIRSGKKLHKSSFWYSLNFPMIQIPKSSISPNLDRNNKDTDFPGDSGGQLSAYNGGDPGSIPVRSSGKGNGNPLQYSCLENPMDG